MYLKDYLKIGEAILNKYYGPIGMADATVELVPEMRLQANAPNHVQRRLQEENLRQRRGRWVSFGCRTCSDVSETNSANVETFYLWNLSNKSVVFLYSRHCFKK